MSAVMSAGWKWLLGAAVLGFGAAFGASYLMRPAYRAEVTVLPESHAAGEDESALSGIMGGSGLISAITGLGEAGTPTRIEFLETLRSAGMARRFLREEGLTSVICEAHVARCSNGAGRGDESAAELSEYAALRAFQRNILTVKEDKEKGVMRLSITWRDRTVAAKWANDYIAIVNRELQSKAVAEARQRQGFLQRSAAATEEQGLRLATYKLLESQLRVEMVASSRPDYAFRIIDSATPPDIRYPARPLRPVIGLIGAVIAFALTYARLLLVRRAPRAAGAALATAPA